MSIFLGWTAKRERYRQVLLEYGLKPREVARIMGDGPRRAAQARKPAPADPPPPAAPPPPPARVAPAIIPPAEPRRPVAGQAWPVERGVFAKMPRDPAADHRRWC